MQGTPKRGRNGNAAGNKPNALMMAGSLGGGGGLGSPLPSDDEEGDSGVDDAQRAERFATTLQGNRFRELEQLRVQQRKDAVRAGLIADPDRPTTLENAIDFRGTCEEMCPEFEREEREFKKNVHPLEQRKDQPGRIDPKKAVTTYHRSAAGVDQPLPSDVRTPATLCRTLDYLLHDVIKTPDPKIANPQPVDCLKYAHPFIRDRTRGIRQDFTYQKRAGMAENIECHERIARFHILSIHELGVRMEADFLKQENEQLNKTLVTLMELYEDQRIDNRTFPNEPEFRAYMLISHINDHEVARGIMDLPSPIFNHPLLQTAFDLRALAQRNFDSQKIGSGYNTEVSQNFFSRFFKVVNNDKVPFLLACLAHAKFGDVRRAALRALTKAYPRLPSGDYTSARVLSMDMAIKLLGCQSPDEVITTVETLGLDVIWSDDNSEPIGVAVNMGSDFKDNADPPFAEIPPSFGKKRHGMSYQQIIDVSPLEKYASARARPVAPTAMPFPNLAPRPPTPQNWQAPKQQPKPSPPITISPPPATSKMTSAFNPPPPIPHPIPLSIPHHPPPTHVAVVRPPPPKALPPPAPTTTKKRPTSDFAVQYLARHIALTCIREVYYNTVTEISIKAFKEEEARRQATDLSERRERQDQALDNAAEGLLHQMVVFLQAYFAGEAFLKETIRRRTIAAAYMRWRSLTTLRVKRREEERRRKQAFRTSIDTMRISRSLREDPQVETWDDMEVDRDEDLTSSLYTARAKHAVLKPGTFLSRFVDHVHHISPLTDIDINVAVSVSSAAQGRWLRRKFGMDIGGEDGPAVTRPNEKTVLVVLEWNGDDESRRRLESLVQNLPSKQKYRISLCLIVWNEEALGVVDEIASRFSSAFASIVASNMALDASDKGFEQALEQSLPSIEETPLMTASLEGLVNNLVPHLSEVLVVSKGVMEQPRSTASTCRKILDCFLQALDTLQQTVCEDFLRSCGLPQIETWQVPSLDSAEWNDRSDVEQSLLRMTSQLVHFENDRVTDLEYALRIEPGPLSQLVLLFIDGISRLVHDHLVNLTFDYLATETKELDLAARDQVKKFAGKMDDIRDAIAAMMPVEEEGTVEDGMAMKEITNRQANTSLTFSQGPHRKRSFESSLGDTRASPTTDFSIPDKSLTPAEARKIKLRKAIEDARRAIAA